MDAGIAFMFLRESLKKGCNLAGMALVIVAIFPGKDEVACLQGREVVR